MSKRCPSCSKPGLRGEVLRSGAVTHQSEELPPEVQYLATLKIAQILSAIKIRKSHTSGLKKHIEGGSAAIDDVQVFKAVWGKPSPICRQDHNTQKP